MSWAATDAAGADLPYVEQIRTDAAAIAGALRAHGPGAPVEHCPGWSVGHAVQHLGEVHRWATAIVRTGEPTPFDEQPPPDSVDVLTASFVAGADALCRMLDAVDPERPCWTFGFPPARAGFWRRRQAYETAVHGFDVAAATGRPFTLAPAMAAHGVTEVVDFMFPRQVALERTAPLRQPVQLRATDTHDAWTVGEPGEHQAEISGPARELLLLLWGRPHDAVARAGDRGALAAFDAAVLVP